MDISIQLLFLFNAAFPRPYHILFYFNTASVPIQLEVCNICSIGIHHFNTASVPIQRWVRAPTKVHSIHFNTASVPIQR